MPVRPLVSVVMPVLNREAFLPESIESVLAQTLSDWEFLISDGGSVDKTRELLRRYAESDKRIQWFDHAGMNIPRARNALLREARGEYVAVLDSDDNALPDRLSLQAGFLEHHRNFLGAGTNLDFIDAAGRPISTERYPLRLTDPAELRRRTLEGWGSFAHTSTMFRRRILNDIGGYRELFRHAEDDDLFLRLLERGELTNLPEKLVRYRCHDENAARPERPLYRAVALASAHLRLAGHSDPVSGHTVPFDTGFLQELLRLLGAGSLPIRLFWIGMLQHHRTEEPAALADEWLRTLELPFHGDAHMESEILRHWRTYNERFPKESAQTAALFGRDRSPGCIFHSIIARHA